MSDSNSARDRSAGGVAAVIRRAFVEFLRLPSVMIAAFLVLAVVMHALDEARISWLEPVRRLLQQFMFQSAGPTRSLVAQVTGSMITATSITFSLLLLSAQQTAASFTPQVLDQFLERRINQAYFGFFVGVSLYSLLILATASPVLNPVFGAAVLMVLVMVALVFLVAMIYLTIDQMRPANVVEAIHDHANSAWETHVGIHRRTRRRPIHPGPSCADATSGTSGFVVSVDIERLGRLASDAGSEVELHVSLGAFVAFGDRIATIRAGTHEGAQRVAEMVPGTLTLDRVAQIETDPGYAVRELVDVAWTSVSTARHHPWPGLLAANALRDLFMRWVSDERVKPEPDGDALPVVYDDDIVALVVDAFTHLAVVASESMTPQAFAAALEAVDRSLAVAPEPYRAQLADTAVRIVPALGDLVLTRDLEQALVGLVATLHRQGFDDEGDIVQEATSQMRSIVGSLASRGSRARIARSSSDEQGDG